MQQSILITPITSIEELESELDNGKIVFAAMSNGKFATPMWNHAIVLYSYYNEQTKALDP